MDEQLITQILTVRMFYKIVLGHVDNLLSPDYSRDTESKLLPLAIRDLTPEFDTLSRMCSERNVTLHEAVRRNFGTFGKKFLDLEGITNLVEYHRETQIESELINA